MNGTRTALFWKFYTESTLTKLEAYQGTKKKISYILIASIPDISTNGNALSSWANSLSFCWDCFSIFTPSWDNKFVPAANDHFNPCEEDWLSVAGDFDCFGVGARSFPANFQITVRWKQISTTIMIISTMIFFLLQLPIIPVMIIFLHQSHNDTTIKFLS